MSHRSPVRFPPSSDRPSRCPLAMPPVSRSASRMQPPPPLRSHRLPPQLHRQRLLRRPVRPLACRPSPGSAISDSAVCRIERPLAPQTYAPCMALERTKTTAPHCKGHRHAENVALLALRLSYARGIRSDTSIVTYRMKIDSWDIIQKNAGSIPDTLRYTPGVQFADNQIADSRAVDDSETSDSVTAALISRSTPFTMTGIISV